MGIPVLQNIIKYWNPVAPGYFSVPFSCHLSLLACRVPYTYSSFDWRLDYYIEAGDIVFAANCLERGIFGAVGVWQSETNEFPQVLLGFLFSPKVAFAWVSRLRLTKQSRLARAVSKAFCIICLAAVDYVHRTRVFKVFRLIVLYVIRCAQEGSNQFRPPQDTLI